MGVGDASYNFRGRAGHQYSTVPLLFTVHVRCGARQTVALDERSLVPTSVQPRTHFIAAKKY
jgi:hypothetical protein